MILLSLLQISSSSEETIAASPSQGADASSPKLAGEPSSAPSVPSRSVGSPLPMAMVNLIGSEVADEGPTAIQGEDLGVEKAFEQHEATAGDEGSGPIGGEEPIPIEEPEVIVPDNRDEDMGNEGLNVSQEEGPDERLEQSMAIVPDDLDGGVRDEGPSRGGWY
ncbi:hypothetical protein AMTR_s00096p00165210 [Amborella trichopoda]|uniref:Uncharacterized protein n=1 Tax=Amborella trichopoda TaxID=13333 RepID=W1P3E9_AMBTC|nr:hypothetical protein AMTR_s00096p00165210 [Amborella trichopoda]